MSQINKNNRATTNTIKIGQEDKGQGVYIGFHPICSDQGKCNTPNDPVHDGDNKNIYHHFFCAPQDLHDEKNKKKIRLTFNDAAKKVGALKQYHGHNGKFFKDNEAFINEVLKKNYNGEWRIPPGYILEKLSEHQEIGALKGTFSNKTLCSWYISSSRKPKVGCKDSFSSYAVQLENGEGAWRSIPPKIKRNTGFVRPIRSIETLPDGLIY